MSRLDVASSAQPIPEPQRTWAEWLAWIATEDHCEWANCYVAWFRTPLGVLAIGAVCSLLCGLFVAPQGYVLLTAIIAVVALGLAWPLIAVRGVRSRFVFEARRGREGQACAAKLVVTNRWPWPVWGLAVNDPLLSGKEGVGLALARVPGWSTSTFNFSVTPSQRGVYPASEIHLGTGFPFGLYQASRPAETPRHLIVWPKTFGVPPLGNTADRAHWRGTTTDNRPGSEGTRLGVRDHRIGDSLRDVHWAKTARYERLIVSERESVTAEDATIIVDSHPGEVAGSATLEWRLRIAASLCESFAASQGRVDLWLGGSKVSGGQTAGDLERLLDDIAKFASGDTPKASIKRTLGAVIRVESDESSIVLRRPEFGVTARRSDPNGPGWIEVDPAGDVPGQLLQGWRGGARRAIRAD